jgi:hypothetical protein
MPSNLKSGSFTLLKPTGPVQGLKKKKKKKKKKMKKKKEEEEEEKCSFTSSTFKPYTVSLKMFIVARALIAHHTPVLTKCTGTS